MFEEDLPVYRITVELIVPGKPSYAVDYLHLRAWDSGRAIGPLSFGPQALTRFSVDLRSLAISMWVARPGQNFYDGPWVLYSERRPAVPGDFGLMETGLSEDQ